MIDVYVIKRKNEKEYDANYTMTEENFRKNLHYPFTISEVKRYKEKTMSFNLNKSVREGNQPLLIIANAGVCLSTDFDVKVITEFFNDSRLGALGCLLVDRDDRVVDAGIADPWEDPMWRKFQEKRTRQVGLDSADYDVYLDGKFILIRRDTYKDVKGFDEQFDKFWAINFVLDAAKKDWKIKWLNHEVQYFTEYEKDKNRLKSMYEEERGLFEKKFFPNGRPVKGNV